MKDIEFQRLLVLALFDRAFFETIAYVLKEEYFVKQLRPIVKAIKVLFTVHEESTLSLRDLVLFLKNDINNGKIWNKFYDSNNSSENVDIKNLKVMTFSELKVIDKIDKTDVKKFIKDDAADFFKSQGLKNSVVEKYYQIRENLDLEDLEEKSRELANNIMSILESGDFKNSLYDLDATDVSLKTSKIVEKRKVAMPWDVMNTLTNGGSLEGGFHVIMAPSGYGKTTFCCELARKALFSGKNILYYTMELDKGEIMSKIDCGLVDINLNDVYNIGNSEKVSKYYEKYSHGKFFIKEFLTKPVNTIGIRAHYKRISRALGIKFDMVFIDHFGKVLPSMSVGKRDYDVVIIAEELRRLAKEENLIMWSPFQANRGPILSPNIFWITEGYVSESYLMVGSLDLLMTLNRKVVYDFDDETLQEEKIEVIFPYIAKSRLGPSMTRLVGEIFGSYAKMNIYGMETSKAKRLLGLANQEYYNNRSNDNSNNNKKRR